MNSMGDAMFDQLLGSQPSAFFLVMKRGMRGPWTGMFSSTIISSSSLSLLKVMVVSSGCGAIS